METITSPLQIIKSPWSILFNEDPGINIFKVLFVCYVRVNNLK